MVTKTSWKPAIKFVLVVSWNLASISRHFPVICNYPLQWDFLYVAPQNDGFWSPNLSKLNEFQFGLYRVSLCSVWRTTHLYLVSLTSCGYGTAFTFLGKTPVLCDDLWLPASSFVVSSITRWTARISREQFDLESSHFIGISIPTYFTATLDVTS